MLDEMNERAGRIVVGIDGSECSMAAMRWAMAQSSLTGSTVEVVAAWQEPAMYGLAYASSPALYEGDSMATITEKLVRECVVAVVGELDHPVEVPVRVTQGHPAQVLLDAATGARLLVVGTRGHGGFAGLLLGSVSQQCVQHATCPVVVVP